MTGLDPSPNRSYSSSRRPSQSHNTEPLGNKDPEPVRRSHASLSRGRSRAEDDGSPPPLRHYERGHALPNNHNLEPKDAIPYRNQHLGLPSQRRHMEFASGCSPQRRMTYSNFRHSDSQPPTGPNSPSPRSAYASPSRRGESRSRSRRRGSVSQSRAVSTGSSRHRSGNRSPTDRHDSVALPTQNRKASSSGRRTGTESPCQSSQRHSLDSERLYNNLTSIATSAALTESQQNTWPDYNTETDGYYHGNHNGSNSHHSGSNSRHSKRNSGRNSGASSPRRRRDSGSQICDRTAINTNHGSDISKTYPRSMSDRHARVDPEQSDSSHGSTHSLLSPVSPHHSLSPSPNKHSSKQQPLCDSSTAPREVPNTDRSRSTIRRGLEALMISSSDESRRPDRSTSPPMTFEDYVMLADIPRTSLYTEAEMNGLEAPGMVRRRPQSQSPRRDYQQPARSSGMADGSSECRDSEERGRGRERGRDRRERERKHPQQDAGKQTETKLTSSHARRRLKSPTGEECDSRRQEKFIADQHLTQLTNLNFKKGWLFRLDEDDEWRKYWFVLTDLGLKYFIDSLAEERDEPEGEIDLSSCVDVIESDVEKNYGFQVHTKASVITLSAMTSRIRRNWIEILRRNIFSGNPPDQCHGSRAEIRVSKASSPGQDQDQDQESTLVTAPLTNQREAGEGRDREQEKKLEDRTKWFQEGVMMISDGLNSRWDTIELKKGTSQTTVQFAENIVVRGKDIDGKWEDFERLPFGEMKSPRLDGSSNYESTNEGEVSSPRQQRDASCFGKTEGSLSTGVGDPCVGGPCVGGPCGPGAPCGPRLRTLEQLYKATLETAQKEHERQMEKLQKEKEYLLTEEAEAAAKTIEALKKAHRDELEDARRPAGREGLTERRKQSSEVDELQVELDGLSERYSEKCVELKHVQQNSKERNTEINRTETDIEHLRKENQELQSRLTEEITLMRSFITGQKSQSQFISHGNHEQSSDMEVLLRAKENEILYLKKEISCLRNEVASLTKEKESVCERFKEVYVELSRVKGASEREMGCLREHLSLTRAAMQEQQLMRNSS